MKVLLAPGRALLGGLLVFTLLLAPALALAAGTLTITCIDVGQGDSTLIQSPSGQTLLFDGGDNGRGTGVVLPLLQAKGISHLDYMVASHYHADHIGGLDEVAGGVSVGTAYDRGWQYGSSTATFNSYVAAVSSFRQQIQPGQVIDLGEGVTVTCLAVNGNDQVSSPYTTSTLENEYDVCLLVEYGGFDFFVAGDLTGGGGSYRDIETSVAPIAGDVDVYHVSHHGSYSSSNAFFLQTVQAEVAVISVGSNSYGHPHQEVLDRLDSYGSFVYQTETGSGGTLPASSLAVVGGHIVIQTDGQTTYTVDGDAWTIDEEPVSAAPLAMAPGLTMLGNSPNPFNPATVIRFESPVEGPGRLEIFDLAGRRIFAQEFVGREGANSLTWNGRDSGGQNMPGGVYLYSVRTGTHSGRGRMVLLK